MSTMQQFDKVLEYCRKNMCTPDGKRVCFVCGHVPEAGEDAAIGVFIANEDTQKRIGAPPNKTRMMIYLLCANCHAHPDRNQIVEKKILAVAGVQ